MAFISALLGSIVAIVPLVAVLVLLPHVGKIKSQVAQRWIHRFFIVVAYGTGTLLAATEVGAVWLGIVNRVTALIPGLSGAAVHAAVTIAAFILIVGLIVSFLFAPTAAVVPAAAFIPAVLMLTTGGFVHGFWEATSGPAQQLAAQFGHAIGG